jgi:hypothetical protein
MSRIDEIRERLSKATPGPWMWNPYTFRGGYSGIVGAYNTDVLYPNRCNDGDTGDAWFEESPSEADRELIAHAITDIPALLQHIEELASLLQRARKVIAAHSDCYPDCCEFCPDKKVCANKAVLDEIRSEQQC